MPLRIPMLVMACALTGQVLGSDQAPAFAPTPVPTPIPKDKAPTTEEIQALVQRVQESQVQSDLAIDKLLEAAHPRSP